MERLHLLSADSESNRLAIRANVNTTLRGAASDTMTSGGEQGHPTQDSAAVSVVAGLARIRLNSPPVNDPVSFSREKRNLCELRRL